MSCLLSLLTLERQSRVCLLTRQFRFIIHLINTYTPCCASWILNWGNCAALDINERVCSWHLLGNWSGLKTLNSQLSSPCQRATSGNDLDFCRANIALIDVPAGSCRSRFLPSQPINCLPLAWAMLPWPWWEVRCKCAAIERASWYFVKRNQLWTMC